MFITQAEIDRLINEDNPHIDLTTTLLDIKTQISEIKIVSCESGIIAGTSIVERVFQTLGVTLSKSRSDGDLVHKGDLIMSGIGSATAVTNAWMVSLNILSYCSGVATATRKLVDLCQSTTPPTNLFLSRKSIPGVKTLTIPAILAGGAIPQAFDRSETIMIFEQHQNFFETKQDLADHITKVKHLTPSKPMIMHATSTIQASKLARMGAEIIQLYKIPADQLKIMIRELKKAYPKLIILAVANVNENNIQEYLNTGADGIVATSPYFSEPLALEVNIAPVKQH